LPSWAFMRTKRSSGKFTTTSSSARGTSRSSRRILRWLPHGLMLRRSPGLGEETGRARADYERVPGKVSKLIIYKSDGLLPAVDICRRNWVFRQSNTNINFLARQNRDIQN
jgi:hypothetical protein